MARARNRLVLARVCVALSSEVCALAVDYGLEALTRGASTCNLAKQSRSPQRLTVEQLRKYCLQMTMEKKKTAWSPTN
uniref:Secreted protein n=1 Tax=Acrobeloides nanus TaxID=290746 RepID=A0A914C747_9BILA